MEIDRRALAMLPWELRAEIDENLCRKDFLPSEIAQVQRACQAILERQARERQGAAGPTSGKGAKPNGSRNLSLTAPGRTSDKIGSLFGLSGRTLEKIAAVCEAAVAEPAKYGKLAADMDRSGRANGPYRRLCNIRQAEAIRAEPPPLPGKGPYRAGFVDFPWAYELLGETALGRGVLPYATMTLDEACAFARSLRSLLAPDAAVGVWVTNFILARGLHLPILEAWDLEPKEVITWPKERAGQGHWARGQSEHFVLAVRGKPTVTLSNHRPCSWARSMSSRRTPTRPSRSRPMTGSRASSPRRATAIFSAATGTMSAGIATASKRRRRRCLASSKRGAIRRHR